MEDVVKEFLVESSENLDQLDRDLVALEKDPTNKATLSSIFRNVHTIKGTCGFLGFGRLQHVTHVGETLLGRLRDGTLNLNAERTSALLAPSDAVRAMLACIEETGAEGDIDHTELVNRLQSLLEDVAPALGDSGPAPARVPASHPTTTTRPPAEGRATPAVASGASSANNAGRPAVAVSTPAAAPATPASTAVPAAAERTNQPADTPPSPAAAAAPAPAPAPATNAEHADGARGGTARPDSTVRVDVGLLDALMNQVGELVLARNQLLQYAASAEDPLTESTGGQESFGSLLVASTCRSTARPVRHAFA